MEARESSWKQMDHLEALRGA